MNKNHIAVGLYLCFAMAMTMVSAQVQGIEGETMRIACNVAGTLPRWIKDSNITFSNEGNPEINPDYSTRFSYAADQKTLIVNPVQLSDAGRYACLIGGISGTDVVVSVIKPEDNACSNPCPIAKAVIAFFVLAMVVIIVVIIYYCILIRAYMEYKKMKVTQEDNNATAELVILIIAAVLFIVVFIWFIVMQTTVEDCEEMTKKECNINIGLLVVEIFVFVLGVIVVRRAYIWQSQLMNGNCREKIFQILTDAYPEILTVEDLRTKMGFEADIIEQELEKLTKEDLIISRNFGFVVKDHISKTELIRERILLFLGNAFPEALTTDDLQKIIPGAEDIGQHLRELEEDHLIRSTQYGFVFDP